ncbi:hypothetical protein EIN_412340 [Entamoeba invadens IP1]|uniref:Uncharacterized protein n=1 Tax=Entamoeba invadens IP1 TaxID=370355 RepID=A0A0A1UHH4_ENTIV|nr:hypothetical protein EIN_412340 [Entamoeba invadens IP1]ELP95365.1 hypothetical protein EIN_412340 [Entamoeba invadens IP1]|eukprot:XP_004262136.1 hypothetical protein EIN_412340 [Entamoeba invadens IP1]
MSNSKESHIKCCFVGDDNVGMTSLIHSFMGLLFSDKVIPFQEELIIEHISFNNTDFEMSYREIKDDSDQSQKYLHEANALISIFSFDIKESLEHANKWLSYGCRLTDYYCREYLVETKCDLQERVYSYDEYYNISHSSNASYYEVSNKTGSGIKQLKENIISTYYSDTFKQEKRKQNKGECQLV